MKHASFQFLNITVPMPFVSRYNANIYTNIAIVNANNSATSDLNNLDSSTYDWAKVGPTIAICLGFHDEAEDHKLKMEEAYRKRDALIATIDEHLKGSRTYLKGKYANQPKKLGNWGFEVDNTAKALKKKV
jgi:hypothetical protein